MAGVTGDGKPFLTISWQTEGQQAYEVEVNGKAYGPYYGEDVRSFSLDEPLADGSYTVRVRAQNRYGLWSEPAETQIFISNTPKGAIALSGEFGVDAELIWTYDGEDDPETVAIYRDGKWIGLPGPVRARDA